MIDFIFLGLKYIVRSLLIVVYCEKGILIYLDNAHKVF